LTAEEPDGAPRRHFTASRHAGPDLCKAIAV